MEGLALLAGLTALLVALQQPRERVVLLPQPDGTVGAVQVRSSGGDSALLDSAFASATIDAAGRLRTETLAAAAVRERYAATLAALPPRPRSFTVYFESGSATDFVAASRPVLDDLKAFLADHPAPQLTVIGHTDRVGALEFNDRLSLARAETVRAFLLELGIGRSPIEVVGRGEREPLVPTADEVPEERNRRVEISVR